MQEILKNKYGEIDYTKLFMAFGAMIVLILQQWQGYRIAEIKATADAQTQNFMSRKEIYNHIEKLENNFVPKEEITNRFNNIENILKLLESKHENK